MFYAIVMDQEEYNMGPILMETQLDKMLTLEQAENALKDMSKYNRKLCIVKIEPINQKHHRAFKDMFEAAIDGLQKTKDRINIALGVIK